MWNLKYDKNELIGKQKQTQSHREQTCGCQEGDGLGEGWIGSLGLADANYYIENGLKRRSYCIAHLTIYNIL